MDNKIRNIKDSLELHKTKNSHFQNTLWRVGSTPPNNPKSDPLKRYHQRENSDFWSVQAKAQT